MSAQPAHQKPLQQDWANREYIEVITGSIKKITDFLNSFDTSCRSRLATLNQKLTELERRVEYIEARIVKGESLWFGWTWNRWKTETQDWIRKEEWFQQWNIYELEFWNNNLYNFTCINVNNNTLNLILKMNMIVKNWGSIYCTNNSAVCF